MRPVGKRLLDDGDHLGPLLAYERHARGAAAVVGAGGERLDQLDVLHKPVGDIEVEQRLEPAVDGERLGQPALLHQAVYRDGLGGEGADEAGATRPRDVFARNQCAAQCAKCVCEMREMIQESRETFAMAAE